MKKHDLFELIHALSKSEKRYFKLYCSRQNIQGNYLRVFEILEKQYVFDEKSLRKQLGNQVFLKQLHVTKNYLREKILESLRLYHRDISKDAEVKDLLRNVELLCFKELYAQADAELKRAEVLAAGFEIFTAQIEISRWKRKLEQTLHPNRFERLGAILESQETAAKALQVNLDLWKSIVQNAEGFMHRGNSNAVSDHWMKMPQNELNLESKVLYFNNLYVRSLREGQQESAEKSLTELIVLLENHPQRVKEDPLSYVTTVNNLAGFYVFRAEGALALQVISRHRKYLEKLGWPDPRRPVLKQVIRTMNIELELFRIRDVVSDQANFLLEAEAFVKKLAPGMPASYLLSFQFQFAWISFLKRDFSNALNWIQEPLNAWRKNGSREIFRYILWLNLMIHCELGNFFALPYFVESARRHFKKSRPLLDFEQELLHFFGKMATTPVEAHKALYTELKLKLFPSTGQQLIPEEVSRMIDLGRWLR